MTFSAEQRQRLEAWAIVLNLPRAENYQSSPPVCKENAAALRALLTAYDSARRDAGRYRHECERAQARADSATRMLGNVLACCGPNDVRAPDGKVYRYNDPDPALTLRVIQSAIRAAIEERNSDVPREFCRFCGAGIGKFRREGEGTCTACDPPRNSDAPREDCEGICCVHKPPQANR